MQWRLNAMTFIVKGILMAAIVFAGANVVRNVTAALHAATIGCSASIEKQEFCYRQIKATYANSHRRSERPHDL